MNNKENVIDTIFIGIVVANFLLNTGRGLKAIDLSKEFVNFLDNNVVLCLRELPDFFWLRLWVDQKLNPLSSVTRKILSTKISPC